MNAFHIGTGRTQLTFSWQIHGADLRVHIGGGADHIGAAALAAPTISVQTAGLPPHREEEIVREVAERLAQQLRVTVCVTAGIHVDQITREEIQAIRAACAAGADRLVQILQETKECPSV
ncbi:MAG: hypothetical protein JXB13_11915 [Phycisphaerae bacterium]|nr:hypothetical protein [Phycisphaerae bacterium]